MKISTQTRFLLTTTFLLTTATQAYAYGPEGLFGGRPQPDSSIVLENPVELRDDRPERAESVLDHPRPDFDPIPYEVGSFEIFPTLELGPTVDSNIYVEPDQERADVVGTIRPIVNVFSNWTRHAISLTAFADANHYSQHPDENYNNAVLDLSGRFDIYPQTWVSGRTGYQRLAESRTSPNAANGEEPTFFDYTSAGVTAYRGRGKVKASADYDFHRFDYDDVPSTSGIIDEDVRDRDEHIVGAKVGYEVSSNVQPYLRGAYNWRKYRTNSLHDAHGFETVVGLQVDMGGITSMDVFAGWMQQKYPDFGTKPTVNSPRFGGRVNWNVTGLTSVVFEFNRTVEETSLSGYHSFSQTGASTTVTHELRRNVILEGDLNYSHYDFNGTGGRNDDLLTLGLGGRYLINRSLYTDLLYSFDKRYSTDEDSEYNRHMGTVRLGVHL